MKRRVYVASSWRNGHQPDVVQALRFAGHCVYDFRNPTPEESGFSWSEIDRDWLNWSPEEFARELANNPLAAHHFGLDKAGLDWCDTCVLVLPCGRSAHLEAGYAIGQGKDTYFLLHPDKFEPELMYKLGAGCSTSLEEIAGWMDSQPSGSVMRWHSTSGGHFARPASHAVRLLREVVELCIASGATPPEMMNAINAEFGKALARHEIGGDRSKIPQEWADCAMLLDIFAEYAGIERGVEIRKKLAILWGRAWEADAGGALYRPGDAPT